MNNLERFKINSKGNILGIFALVIIVVIALAAAYIVVAKPDLSKGFEAGGAGISGGAGGGTGLVCPAGTSMQNGVCVSVCPAGSVWQNGVCVSTSGLQQICESSTTTTTSFSPIEKYLQGTAIDGNNLTISRKQDGAWKTDQNANNNLSLSPNSKLEYLIARDIGSSDYYGVWVKEHTTSPTCRTSETEQIILVREGTLTNTKVNNDGVTKNNAATSGAIPDINAGETYLFKITSRENSADSAFGNPSNDVTQKAVVCLDGNGSFFTKLSVAGITATSADTPANHVRDGNGLTSTWCYTVNGLQLEDYAEATWYVKAEVSTGSGRNQEQWDSFVDDANVNKCGTSTDKNGTCSRIRFRIYDGTLYKNTDTGKIEASTYNKVTNADLGVSVVDGNLFYQ